jgi:flavin reductase (DIM6/NTAB) family NADH-FMN oxidoreductase RutF
VPQPLRSIGAAEFRAAMGSFAASVTVVATLGPDGRAHGLTATAFSSVSIDPPLCLVCIDRRARAHAPLLASRRFAVSVLGAEQQASSRHFARDTDDKFDGHAWVPGSVTGCPVLQGSIAAVECEIADVHEGGDHTIVVGRIVGASALDGAPLLYWRGAYGKFVSD